MKLSFLFLATSVGVQGFAPAHPAQSAVRRSTLPSLHSTPEPTGEGKEEAVPVELTPEQEEQVGNLVADEEWVGLSMELADVVKTAVVEDLKKNSRDFLGADEYKMGDFSKEIDRRVKEEVASIRGKDDYELGDMSVVLDDKIKELVCELSGKDDYEFGDLSVELDKRMKVSVAGFCGKDNYEFGDLSKEMSKRTQQGVLAYTGKSDYKFGDITKKAMGNLSGKGEDYQFGDVTKKLMGNLFNKDKK